jgi:hypothetical protein
MTRKFRLGLFVCMAAAVGLHARPCWTSCLIPAFGMDRAEARIAAVDLPLAVSDPAFTARARPNLSNMLRVDFLRAEASPLDGASLPETK